MNKIILEGDLHIRADKIIHYKARQEYIKWFLNSELNTEDNIFISLGDVFEHSLPSPKETRLALYYYQNIKCKRKIILAGNHDYNRIKNTYSIDPLAEIQGVELIKKPIELSINNISFRILPYYYDHIYPELKSMKEEYQSYSGNYDFILSHIQDETMDFGSHSSIDISKLKGTRLQGHIHVGGKNYVESPIPNKTPEMIDKRHIYTIDMNTKQVDKIEIPDILRFATVRYPEPMERPNSKYVFWTILDSVDRETTIKHYEEQESPLYIQSIKRKRLQEDTEIERSGEIKTIREMWDTYKQTKKVSLDVSKIVEKYLQKDLTKV